MIEPSFTSTSRLSGSKPGSSPNSFGIEGELVGTRAGEVAHPVEHLGGKLVHAAVAADVEAVELAHVLALVARLAGTCVPAT